MKRKGSVPVAAGLALCGLALCISKLRLSAFTAGRLQASILTPVHTNGAARQGSLIAMRSQGQAGRFNHGQLAMPTVKGGKKMAVFRPRNNYGSHGARKVPIRYPLYDILEEIDEKIPAYTVVSEPEEFYKPDRDAPLTERYPWAGSLEKVPQQKQDLENGEDALEPLFGSIVYENLPPTGRSQNYVLRRGWPRYDHPPWINRPKWGTEVKVPHRMKWKKDRRPEEWQLPRSLREQFKKPERLETTELEEEVLDEMEDALDAFTEDK